MRAPRAPTPRRAPGNGACQGCHRFPSGMTSWLFRREHGGWRCEFLRTPTTPSDFSLSLPSSLLHPARYSLRDGAPQALVFSVGHLSSLAFFPLTLNTRL